MLTVCFCSPLLSDFTCHAYLLICFVIYGYQMVFFLYRTKNMHGSDASRFTELQKKSSQAHAAYDIPSPDFCMAEKGNCLCLTSAFYIQPEVTCSLEYCHGNSFVRYCYYIGESTRPTMPPIPTMPTIPTKPTESKEKVLKLLEGALG